MESREEKSFDEMSPEPNPVLVLIDSNAIIHRSYHALPKNMSTSRGEPTNAVYGFTTTLIKVLEELKPDYLAAAFDMAGPTFRHEEYQDYKATRVKADQELYDQIPMVKELLESMEIPVYEREGFEADDIIGTIVEKIMKTTHTDLFHPPAARQQSSSLGGQQLRAGRKDTEKKHREKLTANSLKLKAYIVSGDKDIFQLVDGNVKIYNLKKGLSQTQIVDRESIKKDYDLDPEDFIDLKALAGDPSDNIPGVPGIGPKTATELIQKFDTLKNLYEKLEIINKKHRENIKKEEVELAAERLDLKPRVVQLLVENKEQAFMSQKLATIHRDVPIEFTLEEMKRGEYDKEKLRAFFERLGFRSLLRRFNVGETNKPSSEKQQADKQLRLI